MTEAAQRRTALSVRNIFYSYGKKAALQDISFDLAPGRVTALLGPNGAGKTTLFSLITGLFDCRKGEVVIAGHPLRSDRSAALASLGIVFQAQTLELDLSIDQNLRYFAALRGLTRHEARNRIDMLLAAIGLAGLNKTKVRKLSGGQRRRVEVARALLDHPALLLLDEPSTGLDIATRRWLINHVHTLAREEGMTVLLATHLVDEVAAEDDVIVLDKGLIVATGRVDAVVASVGAADLDDAFTRMTAQNAVQAA